MELMSDLKENGMSNGEVLAAVNKICNQNPETSKLPKFSWFQNKSLNN
jgi:hypothetical protein